MIVVAPVLICVVSILILIAAAFVLIFFLTVAGVVGMTAAGDLGTRKVIRRSSSLAAVNRATISL